MSTRNALLRGPQSFRRIGGGNYIRLGTWLASQALYEPSTAPRYPFIQHRRLSEFRIIEHTVRCQHTRDRPAGAELGRENDLRLHVKQYVPQGSEPKPGDVTIIGAHANGFPKEVYEPFWNDLYGHLRKTGHGVRGIWIADMASQGQSGILNEHLLGPDPSWYDHGRDLLFLINQFQDAMPGPLIGVGHSVGASQLVHLSLLHPRLLHSLVLVDPIIQKDLEPHKALARLSTRRRDVWPSREDAAKQFSSSKFYQQWDPRALDKWIEYGLRNISPKGDSGSQSNEGKSDAAVTLSTTKAQEVYFYLRAAYRDDRLLQGKGSLLQDIHLGDQDDFPFIRPEGQQLYRRLPEVNPSVLYIFGNTSPASTARHRANKMKLTGTGVGGNGGASNGKVQEAVLECGHLVGLERPTECAQTTAKFISSELDRWESEEREKSRLWNNLTRRQRVDINDQWTEHLSVTSGTKPVG